MQTKPLAKKPVTKLIARKVSVKRKTSSDQEISPKVGKQIQIAGGKVTKFKRKATKSNTSREVKADSSDQEDSIDSVHFAKQTTDVKNQILKSLMLFKSATDEYIRQNKFLEKEVEHFGAEFEQVKTEVSEILVESSKSKTELLQIRKKIRETPEKCEIMPRKLSFQEESLNLETSFNEAKNKTVQEKVEELRKEINEIKQYISENEEELKDYESENSEFKNITIKIKENLQYKPLSLESSKEQTNCKSCWIC